MRAYRLQVDQLNVSSFELIINPPKRWLKELNFN